MSKRPTFLLGACVLLSVGLAVLALRECASDSPTAREVGLANHALGDSGQSRPAGPLDATDQSVQPKGDVSGLSAESKRAAIGSSGPLEPRQPVSAASPFPNATGLMADPFYNPQQRNLSRDQRHELQAIVDQANAKLRELMASQTAQAEVHARELIARGEFRPVTSGEKVKLADPKHDSLQVINDGSGGKAVSFASHDVPEIAVFMDAQTDVVHGTTEQIRSYFASH